MKTPTKMLCGLALLCALGLGWMTTSSRAANPAAMNKTAPELSGSQWLNTDKPITLASRKGKVTLVEFWTFGCSNCQANLPSYARLYEKFKGQDVTIIGVHTPETDYEANPKNVARRVKELGITYPVLIDAKSENWNRWQQQYWPTIYLVDKSGKIRYQWIGELESGNAGGEAKIAGFIKTLLDENDDAMSTLTSTQPTTQVNAETSPKLSSAQLNAAKNEPVGKVTKTEAQWKKILTPAQFNILRQAGTEPAFSGDHEYHGAGIYRCAACGLPLYDAATEFDSGTGWPSFYQPINKTHVIERKDADGERKEVLCARCGGHLGHVFNDGPKPTGLRYCMNAAALKFEPAKAAKATTHKTVLQTAAAPPQVMLQTVALTEADQKSSTQAKAAPQKAVMQKATFAAGCFWSMEAIFKQLKGVQKVEPGYAGGTTPNPTYEKVETGTTGYAETIDITYDPKVISYQTLLDVLLTVRNPTTKNKQGPDEGPQYRSIIFYRDAAQKAAAQAEIKKFTDNKVWGAPIVTEVKPFSAFHQAEAYHFNYYNLHPDQPYCAGVIAPEIKEFREKFKDKLKS